ncbi:amidohydrolase family protein [Paucilactobacillus hokkaidonensis]|uniref:amidohydrolase family protein n=1 Tax=Paucilactobacillus hokkaidonensis TaxID=1193095 RepID=UPI000A633F6B|nr:amidohydrolase family protein [Paucilactobacillus hokkaidonensis]
MKLITAEEHISMPYANKIINDYLKTQPADPKAMKEFGQSFAEGLVAYHVTPEEMQDVDENRIKYMDKNGIDVQILSYGDASTNPDMLPAEQSIPLTQRINTDIAATVKRHPDRYLGLATLPISDPKDAAKELKRAVTELDLKGALILGTAKGGQFLDDPKFMPIFEMAAQLDVPLYIHPSMPTETIRKNYYSNMNPIGFNAIMSTPGWGWHMEAGLHVTRLILSGLFDKLPNLKLISGHWGEFVPYFLERLDEATTPVVGNPLKHPVSYYYKKNVYVTPSGMYTWPQMQLVLTEMGADHVIWAQDYPYVKGNAKDFLANTDIANDDKEKNCT